MSVSAVHFPIFAQQDDEMELASDVEHPYPEDNLDIDIDLGDEASRIGTDDYMHDDDVHEQLAMADDDEMIDDIDYEHVDQEAIMQDAQDLRDQQLFDAGLDAEGDTELVEAVIDSYDDHSPTTVPQAEVSVEDSTIDYDHIGDFDIDAEHNADIHDGQVEEDASQADETTPSPDCDDDQAQADEESIPVVGTASKLMSPSGSINDHDSHEMSLELAANMPAEELHEEEYGLNTNEDVGIEANSNDRNPESLDHVRDALHALHDDEEAQFRDDRPPIVFFISDTELDSFSRAATCFYQCDPTQRANLQEVLSACRTELGDSIHQEELLEMDFAELGLTLIEGSLDATAFTLADVLNIFVQLSLNDSADDPTPLYVTLSTRTRFSTRMQALGEAVAAGKGLSQVDFGSALKEYDSEQAVDDEEDLDAVETEDTSAVNAAVQEDEIAQQPEDTPGEVSTHEDALIINDADDTIDGLIAADLVPAEELYEHEETNAQADADTRDIQAVEKIVDVPESHEDDLGEEVEEANLQVDDSALPSLEAAKPAPPIHEDDFLDLEEEHEDNKDDLEQIQAVDEVLEEVDHEEQDQIHSHADGLSDLEDDFDDNLDGEDIVKETEDHIEATDAAVSVPAPAIDALSHSKRSRPEDEDNVSVPAKKQQLASHHSQPGSGSTTET